MDNLLSTIVSNTYTRSDLRRRISLIRNYYETQLFGTKGIEEDISADDKTWLETVVKNTSSVTKDTITQVFTDVEEESEKLPFLSVFIPIDLPADEIDRLARSIREDYGKNSLILDLRIDPLLIAGCALAWGGVYRDYSIRQSIQNRKDEIIASFRKYIR